VWSPDGSHIAFDSNRKGRRNLYLKASSGASTEELLLESAQDKIAMDWSLDGRFLLYGSSDPQTSWDIWVLPMEGERKPFLFLKTNFDERRAKFSPDGRWVAYISNESGRYEIYVRPFDGTSAGTNNGQWQVSTSGGVFPRWRADSKELHYITPDGKLMAVPITTRGATVEPGTPVLLFQTRIVGGGISAGGGTQYDVSADGRFLINTVLEDTASPITLLQNWNPEAKK
jgi:Tol biopolymer transport system component